jgi:WD repeat-containing protein 68
MPFGHHHQNTANNPAAGIYQAAAALGSIGAPMGNLRVATSGQTSAGTDAFQASSMQSPVEQPYTAPPAAQSSFDAPRRAPTLSRAPDSELHIQTSAPSASSQPPQQQNMYNSPENYSAPNIQLQQATPNNPQYAAPTQPIPNALQPAAGAGQQRPGPSSAYTAPAMVPTQNQIPSNAQQYTLPTRSNTIHQSQPSPHSSHTYSRSSPAGMGPEQKYIPFSNTPEQKYAPNTPAQKYYPSTPSGAASHSPLGLADIRPRANSTMDQEGGMGHGNAMMSEQSKVPTNSNYLAPWSIYAYDWCKWTVPGGNSAGKMAVGSYLEDNHNFVSLPAVWHAPLLTLFRFASSTRRLCPKMSMPPAHRLTASSTAPLPKPHAPSLLHGSFGSRPRPRSSRPISSLHLATICDYGPCLRTQAIL